MCCIICFIEFEISLLKTYQSFFSEYIMYYSLTKVSPKIYNVTATFTNDLDSVALLQFSENVFSIQYNEETNVTTASLTFKSFYDAMLFINLLED